MPPFCSDVWSLGCLLYELLTGRLLFERGDWTQFYLRATSASQPLLLSRDLEAVGHRESSVTKQLLSILNMCLVRDPMRRPSAAQVLQRVREVRFELKRQLKGAPTSLRREAFTRGASMDRPTEEGAVNVHGPAGQEASDAGARFQGDGGAGDPASAAPRLDSVDLLPAANLPVLASKQASPPGGRLSAPPQAPTAADEEAEARGSRRYRPAAPESQSMAGERWGGEVLRVTDAGPNALLLDIDPRELRRIAASLLGAGQASSAETEHGMARRGVTHVLVLPQSPTEQELAQVALHIRHLLSSGPWHVAAVVLPAWGDWLGRRLCRLITQEVAGLDPLSAARAATERRIAAA